MNIVKLKRELQRSTESSHLNSLTVKGVVEADYPTILVYKNKNANEIEDFVKLLVVNLAESVNVKNNLTGMQIHRIAHDIIRFHDTLTLEDVYLCFQRISHGIYGPMYDNMSSEKIHAALRKYGEEKDQVEKDFRMEKEAGTMTVPASTGATKEEAKEYIKNIYETIEKAIEKRRMEANTGRTNRTISPRHVQIAENAIHFILNTSMRDKRIMELMGLSEANLKRLKEEVVKYRSVDKMGNTTKVHYDDVWAGFKDKDNLSSFAKLCIKIAKIEKESEDNQ